MNTVRRGIKPGVCRENQEQADKGLEQEVGMSSLMDHPEVAQCLGKNFAWELKALFCDLNGPNLRNNFAHGLETIKKGLSGWAFYAWWLVFRMIMVLRYDNGVSNTSEESPLDPPPPSCDNPKP